ncbi:hypothetical protein HMI55_001613 [Coelomomyces lativittatus]|nr:hypothetical protein HMI55_001613 [Coelomomyces lativittatus]
MKLRLVLLIFNILPPTSPLRAHAFEVLSELAHRHGEMKALGTQLGSLRTWLQEWALPLSEVLRFMKRLSQMFMTAHLSKEAYDTLLLLLPLCQDSKDDFEWVFHQSVYVGLSSSTDVLDLSGLLPFSSWLPHSSPAMWLVHTYVTGNVQAFHTTASPLVASLCEKLKVPMLNFALATDHVRCMHLSRIPSGLTLTYTDLSQVLVCDLDRVERYLLDASHFHGIKAKLNPIDQTVLFLQPHASHFQAEDWDHLTHSLVSWKSKFEKIQTKVLNIGQEDFHLADDSENEEDDEEEKEDGEEQEEEEEEREEQEQEDEEAEEEEVYVESPTEQRVLKNDKKTKEGEENELEETLERIKFE